MQKFNSFYFLLWLSAPNGKSTHIMGLALHTIQFPTSSILQWSQYCHLLNLFKEKGFVSGLLQEQCREALEKNSLTCSLYSAAHRYMKNQKSAVGSKEKLERELSSWYESG